MQSEESRLEHRDDALADHLDGAQQALSDLASRSVEDRLFFALRRVSELEAREAGTSKREDVLRKRIELLSAEIELQDATNRVHDRFPAARIDKTISLLTIVERRDCWLDILTRHEIEGAIFGMYPHDGGRDPINILIVSSGGIGDALYATALVRALFERFDRPQIVFLVENPAALSALENNPYIVQALSLPGDRLTTFVADTARLDIFDLIVDVRYAVSYATPPLSRVPFEFVLGAHSRAAAWQKYARYDWPHLNNKFAKEAVKCGMAKLDLVGYTANLPVSQSTPLHFFVEKELPSAVGESLGGRRFVTVHHGADKAMAGGSGLQTKNLPIETWIDLVSRLHSAQILVVQVGESHEQLIDGVSVDLRGKLALEQTAHLIKYADIHFDTEGGLVHLARAVQGTSVVAFGPTNVRFFGYPDNLNIAAKNCSDCWWTTTTWSARCPRGFAEPECMASFNAGELFAAFQEAKITRSRISSKQVNPPIGNAPKTAVDALVTQALERNPGTVAVSVSTFDEISSVSEALGPEPGGAILFVPASMLHSAFRIIPPSVQVEPYSRFHIPSADETIDRALMFDSGASPEVALLHAIELCRVVRREGDVTIVMKSENVPRFVEAGMTVSKGLPGTRVTVQLVNARSHAVQFKHHGSDYSLITLTCERWFDIGGLAQPKPKGLLKSIRRRPVALGSTT